MEKERYEEDRRILSRQIFFDRQVKMKKWQDSMAGKNEEEAVKILDTLGYKLGEDYVRQYPIGERFVIDFAFVNERIALEIDGDSHLSVKQKKKDKQRDSYLYRNGWIPLRMFDWDLTGYKGSFYKSLIKEIVDERRKQFEGGFLYDIDIPNYKDGDYDFR